MEQRPLHLLRAGASRIEPLQTETLDDCGLEVFVKRDDERYVSAYSGDRCFGGNKWRKLQGNLLAAAERGLSQLVTFGGAYSNHLAATASAGRIFGFETIGIVRGEEVTNPTIEHLRRCGMGLEFVSRIEYRRRDADDYLAEIQTRFPRALVIPEGGSNALATSGCSELAEEANEQSGKFAWDFVCMAAGTGGTLAGFVLGAYPRTKVLGFAVVKGGFLARNVASQLGNSGIPTGRWQMIDDYHFGGYGKFNDDLVGFIGEMSSRGLPLDPIYTGKLLYGVIDLAKRGYFPRGSRILVIHSGGLQGIAGFNQRHGELIK